MLLASVPLYVILCLIRTSRQDNIVSKCCGESSQLRAEKNGRLTCTEFSKSKFQVRTNVTNFLKKDEIGDCVDAEGDIFHRYNVNGSTLFSKEPLNLAVFPKCCPLKHVYDPKKRSCRPAEDAVETYMPSQLIKIGLSHCKIIIDLTFKNYSEASSASLNLRAGDYCLDQDVNNRFVLRECNEGLHICEKKRCFKKCCPDGQSYVGGAFCNDTYVHGLEISGKRYSSYIKDLEDEYEIINGVGCSKVGLYQENPVQYTIGKKGEFRYYYNFTGKFQEKPYYDYTNYCLEHATKGNISDYFLFYCMEEKPLEDKFSLTLWAKILSCVCLVTTVLVYFILGEHKSTFGKILINYCFAMSCLMIVLTITHLVRRNSRFECKLKAYLLVFFNISAFAWVNIMSVDIWMTFGTPKRTIGSDQRRKDLKKFLLYFSYGWGLPLCHTMIILFFDLHRVLPESIQPYLGIYKCFIENRNYSKTVFFLAPQLLFQIINIVLFIKTIIYCIRVKNEIKRMNDSAKSGKYNADKGRLALVVKLAVIMGVIWSCEVTTAFFEDMRNYSDFSKKLEIFLDSITCLQGVFIFLIFICKKRTTSAIKKKLGIELRKISGTMSTTQTSHVNGKFPIYKRQSTMSITDVKV